MLVQEATNTLPRYSIWITLVAAKPSVVLPAVKSRWSSLSFCMVHLLCTEHFGDDILCLLVTKWRSLLVEIDRASSRAPWSQCVMCSSTSMHRSSPLAASSLLKPKEEKEQGCTRLLESTYNTLAKKNA
uniref:Uncharacterized protein n=1 Tax=Aegilops tauschii subsp. strangulata TaxID=200361 RepID=A0A453BC43_AEGTS